MLLHRRYLLLCRPRLQHQLGAILNTLLSSITSLPPSDPGLIRMRNNLTIAFHPVLLFHRPLLSHHPYTSSLEEGWSLLAN